jgi:hypothetical protein
MNRDGTRACGRKAARGQRKKAWVQVNISSREVAQMAALAKARGMTLQLFLQLALRGGKRELEEKIAPGPSSDRSRRWAGSVCFCTSPELERALQWFKVHRFNGDDCLAGLARMILAAACVQRQTVQGWLAQAGSYCKAEDLDLMAYLNSRLAGVPEYRRVKLAAAA